MPLTQQQEKFLNHLLSPENQDTLNDFLDVLDKNKNMEELSYHINAIDTKKKILSASDGLKTSEHPYSELKIIAANESEKHSELIGHLTAIEEQSKLLEKCMRHREIQYMTKDMEKQIKPHQDIIDSDNIENNSVDSKSPVGIRLVNSRDDILDDSVIKKAYEEVRQKLIEENSKISLDGLTKNSDGSYACNIKDETSTTTMEFNKNGYFLMLLLFHPHFPLAVI